MKIGIDASRLTEDKRTGTGNYLYNVIKQLATLDKTNTYCVYFKEEPSASFIRELMDQNPNFTHKTVKKSVLWTQLSLAYNCMTDSVDVLFCPWHTIPIISTPKIKMVSVIHDMQLRSASPIFTLLTILLSSKIIAVSHATEKDILSYLPFVKRKINVVYEGVDKKKFHKIPEDQVTIVKSKYDIKGDYFVYVGTVGVRKNIPNLITGFSKFMSKHDEDKRYEFVIAGNVATNYKNIYDLPVQLGVKNSVKFLGYLPDVDLPALISGSSGLLYASFAEGFGLPILEAMSCEVPVLTSNLSAMSEVAGDAAILVSPNSVDSISEGIASLITDRSQLIEKGIHRMSHFSWEISASKILEILTNI